MSRLSSWDNRDIFPLSSVTGLTEWVDYIPVKANGSPNRLHSTDNLGALHANSVLGSITGKVKWVDYIPVFVVSRNTPWTTGTDGYIPFDSVA